LPLLDEERDRRAVRQSAQILDRIWLVVQGFGIVVSVGIHDLSEIVLESLTDGFSALIDDQALAMGEDQGALPAPHARRANIQNLIWIN
jgi:hypothetical protein